MDHLADSIAKLSLGRENCYMGLTKGSVSGSGTGLRDPGSRRPVPGPETLGLGVRYRTPSKPIEEWLGVRQ